MGGVSPAMGAGGKAASSPRKIGLKQGLFLLLLTFLVVPIVGMLSRAIGISPALTGVTAVMLFIGGLLRMVYALMFEDAEAPLEVHGRPPAGLHGSRAGVNALPAQSAYEGAYVNPLGVNWRDTGDLQPRSVVEGTTKLLEKE